DELGGQATRRPRFEPPPRHKFVFPVLGRSGLHTVPTGRHWTFDVSPQRTARRLRRWRGSHPCWCIEYEPIDPVGMLSRVSAHDGGSPGPTQEAELRNTSPPQRESDC